ncbi:hypothetical protein ACO0RG_001455 [Hanseniaspora osmophila]
MSNNIVVFGGSSHPELVEQICDRLSIKPSQVTLGKFSNGETSISVGESVREKDVYVIQSGCGHVNDVFMQLLILINACKTASANRVTAVMPYFCYSRQPDIPFTSKGAPLLPLASNPSSANLSDNKINGGSSSTSLNYIPVVENNNSNSESSEASFNISNSGYKLWIAQNGTLIANLLTTAGADHVITMDLHDPQFQGFFDIPVDNLYSRPLIERYIQFQIPNYKDAVIVSPDAGGAKRAAKIADALELSFAMVHKEKRCQLIKGPPSNPTVIASHSMRQQASINRKMQNNKYQKDSNSKYVSTTMLVGDVRNKVCILIDDMVDTSYTITRAAKLLKDQGCTKVYSIITHGVFSGDALDRISKNGDIDHIVVTNTVPQKEHQEKLKSLASLKKTPVFEILDVSAVFAEAIRRIHNGESISTLFERGW